MTRRTLVIVNPRSRGGATRRRFDALAPRLREALGDHEVEWTRAPRDAERIAREAVRAGTERLVAAGGDGTVSEVVTGLLAAELGDYAELAILPMGTGGDLPRTLGIPFEIDAALARIATGKTRPIDAGRAEYRDAQGKITRSFFLNVASLGVSALITELVNRGSKALGGRLSFLGGTIRGILRYDAPPITLRVDGRIVHEGPLVLATAANGRYFGGGMHVAPEADPQDGLLDVVVVPHFSRTRLLSELPRLYRGAHIGVSGVALHRGRQVEAEAAPGAVWTEIDGEPLGTLPARFDVLPAAIHLVGEAP